MEVCGQQHLWNMRGGEIRPSKTDVIRPSKTDESTRQKPRKLCGRQQHI